MTAEVALQAVQGDEVVLGAVGSALALDEADEVVLGEMGDERVLPGRGRAGGPRGGAYVNGMTYGGRG